MEKAINIIPGGTMLFSKIQPSFAKLWPTYYSKTNEVIFDLNNKNFRYVFNGRRNKFTWVQQ